MKLDPLSTLRPGGLRRGERLRPAGGTSFAEALGEDAAPSGLTAPAALGAVESLLALQEVAAEGGRNGKAAARGAAVLDELEQIRLGLLLGFIPRERLEQLGRLAGGLRDVVADPRLAEILSEIELRARVELAKLVPSA